MHESKSKGGAVFNQYSDMEFPAYEFREYPKWVQHPAHGRPHLVEDALEEQELMAAHKPKKEVDKAKATAA